MRADDDHREDVEARHERVREVLHLLAIEVAAALAPRVHLAEPERLDVDDQEYQQPESRHDHRRRGERFTARTSRGFLLRVSNWPRRLIAEEHPHGLVDVD